MSMKRRIINPWTWQDQFAFVQANEISHEKRTLICAGQTSNDELGNPLFPGDMAKQIEMALNNLETVLNAADFHPVSVLAAPSAPALASAVAGPEAPASAPEVSWVLALGFLAAVVSRRLRVE